MDYEKYYFHDEMDMRQERKVLIRCVLTIGFGYKEFFFDKSIEYIKSA